MVQTSLNLNQAEKADTIWLAGRRSPLSPLKPSSLPTFPLHSPSNLCFISYPQSCHSMVVVGETIWAQASDSWLAKTSHNYFSPSQQMIAFEWSRNSVLSDKTYKQAEAFRAMLSFSQKNIQSRNIWFFSFHPGWYERIQQLNLQKTPHNRGVNNEWDFWQLDWFLRWSITKWNPAFSTDSSESSLLMIVYKMSWLTLPFSLSFGLY